MSGQLIGDYEMDPKTGLRPCGIAQCHTDHRHGYVVALSSGVRSYIGRDCGKSQFGAEWSRMRSAYSRQRREQSKAEALRQLRAGLHNVLNDWPSLETESTTWARSVLRAFDGLPVQIRETIESRATASDVSVPGSRYETDEEVKRRAFRENRESKKLPPPQMIRFERGPLRGLVALRPKMRSDHLLDMAVPALLREAKALAENETATPDDIGRMNRRLSDIVKQVDNSVAQLREFIDEKNLALLRFIRPIQLAGVTSVRFDGGSSPASPAFVVERL